MTVLRSLLAALVAAAGLVLVAPAPAMACSCAVADPPQHVSMADVVARATLTETRRPDQSGTWSSTDPVTYTFAVAEVFKGEPVRTLAVSSPVSGASCGMEGLREGTEYVVFAAYEDIMGRETAELMGSLCGGTAPASRAMVAEVEDVTGPGSPAPAAAPPAAAPGGAGSGVWIWGSGIGLLVGVGVATLVVGRRRGAPLS